jgi:hypothetical protein
MDRIIFSYFRLAILITRLVEYRQDDLKIHFICFIGEIVGKKFK